MLPIVFADKLPNRPGKGYERLGFIDDGAAHGRPIGTSFLAGRVDLVGLNCATCHAGTIRERADGEPRRVVARNAREPDGPAGLRPLPDRLRQRSAASPRLRSSRPSRRRTRTSGGSRACSIAFVAIPRTRDGILERAQENAWFDVRPPQGPGRVDTFNPYKVLLKIDMQNDRTVGTVDLPSLWNQRDPARPVAALGRRTTTPSKSATRAPRSAPARRPIRWTCRR